jgi:protein gp37
MFGSRQDAAYGRRRSTVMADKSAIEWTEATWNPVTGCDKVSPGCAHCYAETFAERWRGIPGHPYEQGFALKLWPQRLEQPLKWSRSRMIFVNSMSDLFHERIPDAYIEQVFDVMGQAHWHTFQILTKRHERLAELAPFRSPRRLPARGRRSGEVHLRRAVARAARATRLDMHRLAHLRRRVRFQAPAGEDRVAARST